MVTKIFYFLFKRFFGGKAQISEDGCHIVNLEPLDKVIYLTWVKWLRMQGHRLPAILEVTGSNPGPGKINLIEKKTPTGFLTLKKSTYL
jgi:hypothetical protein